MSQSSSPDHPRQPDSIFVAILCACTLLVALVAAGVMSLRRLLLPADAVLSGLTPDGEWLFLVPTVLVGFLASAWVAWTLARRIPRRQGMPAMNLLPDGSWLKAVDWQSTNWRRVAAITAMISMLVAAKGYGSYFYVAEDGVSVRPPLEFSMKHYDWKDVRTVSVQCRRSAARRGSRFQYLLGMSDGQEVDLSKALASVSPKFRAVLAARFAEFIPPHLDAVPGIRYRFDVSPGCLAKALGEQRAMVLSNALSEQIQVDGGAQQE